MTSLLSLKGKIALITGSTRGIGWETARLMAAQGATLLLNGVSDPDLLAQRVAALQSEFGVEAEGLLLDVGDYAELKQAYQTIFRRFKRLDILVNNAGVLESQLLALLTPEQLERALRINLSGAIYHMQYASRLMARNGSGAIVNLTSIMGRYGNSGQLAYASSKAGLIGATLSAAKELAPKGIRVNAVAPGLIDTDMVGHLSPAQREQVVASIGMGRAGTPAEVAQVILFLASDLAAYVTGQVLGVDGGMVV